MNQTTFGIPSYVGAVEEGTRHEAIAGMGAVLTGLLVGQPMHNLSGPGFAHVDFVNMLNNYFDVVHGAHVWKNTVDGDGLGEFWYQMWMNMLPIMISDAYQRLVANPHAPSSSPTPSWQYKIPTPLDSNIRLAARSWFAAMRALNMNFNYTGYNFSSAQGYNNGLFTQPAAAAGMAYIMLTTGARFGFDSDPKCPYLVGAREALDYLLSCEYDVFWEVLVPFGATVAARMNAEHGFNYDVGKLLGWVLQDDKTPARTPFRWGWGTFATSWHGVGVDGNIGSVTDGGGYAFAMDTFVALGAMLPVARYQPAFSRALGKWALNLLNSARLFFPSQLDPNKQTDWAWVHDNDPHRSLPYEGLRYETAQGVAGPYGMGDAKAGGWAGTNLALYGGAYVGLLAAAVRPLPEAADIYELDLLATDFYHDPNANPSFLYYNPRVTTAALRLTARGASGMVVDVFDVVAGVIVASGVRVNSEFNASVHADSAMLLVHTPRSDRAA